jgi:hypothetical protein
MLGCWTPPPHVTQRYPRPDPPRGPASSTSTPGQPPFGDVTTDLELSPTAARRHPVPLRRPPQRPRLLWMWPVFADIRTAADDPRRLVGHTMRTNPPRSRCSTTGSPTSSPTPTAASTRFRGSLQIVFSDPRHPPTAAGGALREAARPVGRPAGRLGAVRPRHRQRRAAREGLPRRPAHSARARAETDCSGGPVPRWPLAAVVTRPSNRGGRHPDSLVGRLALTAVLGPTPVDKDGPSWTHRHPACAQFWLRTVTRAGLRMSSSPLAFGAVCRATLPRRVRCTGSCACADERALPGRYWSGCGATSSRDLTAPTDCRQFMLRGGQT